MRKTAIRKLYAKRLAACKTLASTDASDARLAHSGGPREVYPPARGRRGPTSGSIRPEWQHGTKARYKGNPSSPRRPGAAPPSAASGGARKKFTCLRFRSVGGIAWKHGHFSGVRTRILVHARPQFRDHSRLTAAGGSQDLCVHSGTRDIRPRREAKRATHVPPSAASSPKKRDSTPPRPTQTARAAS